MRVFVGGPRRLATVAVGIVGVMAVLSIGARTNGSAAVSALGDRSTTSAPTGSPTTTATFVTAAPVGEAAASDALGVVVSPRGVAAPVLEDGATRIVRTPCGRPIAYAGGEIVRTADVVIDAGHGGKETGAVGPGGTKEKSVTLAVAQLVTERLRQSGLTVVQTRGGDYRMTLFSRSAVARAVRARAFVSIHFNADPDGPSNKPGTETYFQHRSRESRRLAGLLYERIVAATGPLAASWVADTDAGAKDRVNQSGDDYYAVLRHAPEIPSVLAELAYISNPPEEAMIRTESAQRVLADAVAAGVSAFLTSKANGSGFVDPYPRDMAVGGGDSVPSSCVDPPM
jgi:N-acetylmuramoyl-L-alanine amidase